MLYWAVHYLNTKENKHSWNYNLCKKRKKEKKNLTHEGKVRLVDLGDSVVAGIEVGCVFGKGWYAV